jgi:hypothetical protein
MILGRHQASATLENAFNKVERNLIRLVHPDKVSSISGDGVYENVVKKDFEEASTDILPLILRFHGWTWSLREAKF